MSDEFSAEEFFRNDRAVVCGFEINESKRVLKLGAYHASGTFLLDTRVEKLP